MTYKEKFELDHPKMNPGDLSMFYSHFCPNSVYEAKDPDYCVGDNNYGQCTKCWEREIPEEQLTKENLSISEDIKRAGEAAKKAVGSISALASTCISTIKDSGDRTQFETGAVRDMREGKGRCDLMPLGVVGVYLADDGINPILESIADFQKDNDTAHLYNALAYFDEGHWDNCYTMCLEVAKHFEDGAKKYGENNWQKGIPVKCYIDSAIRHYLKWLRGDTDEPHDRAFVWNIMCCIWEVDYHEKKETE